MTTPPVRAMRCSPNGWVVGYALPQTRSTVAPLAAASPHNPDSPTSRGLVVQVGDDMRRPCLESGCPETQAQSRCAKHRGEREQARGTREQRGYGTAHKKLRAHYQQRMDEGERFSCWRCAEAGRITVINPSNWTLGHCDDDRSRYHGPECPPCDYATMGRTAPCPHRSHIPPTRPPSGQP